MFFWDLNLMKNVSFSFTFGWKPFDIVVRLPWACLSTRSNWMTSPHLPLRAGPEEVFVLSALSPHWQTELITLCRNNPNCSQSISVYMGELVSRFCAAEITTSGEPRPGCVNKKLSFDSRCFGTASVSSISLKSSSGVEEVQRLSV